jgi:hypothetical protein
VSIQREHPGADFRISADRRGPMRSADEMQSTQYSPTAHADGYAETDHRSDETPPSPYKAFFDALEELEDNKALYGKASLEARVARGRLDQLRILAVEAWRSREAA